jgi:hypothetical protein
MAIPVQNKWRAQRWLIPFLIVLLTLPPRIQAQAPGASPITGQTLRVIALAGNDEMNDLERKVMAPLAIQVLDQNDQPVESAEVVFRFPVNGPSATFLNGLTSQTTRTDATGQARATAWMANNQAGSFRVQVTAFRGTEQGQTTIQMMNVTRIVDVERTRKKSWWSSPWVKLLVIGGAAGLTTGIVLSTRGSGSTSTVPITGVPGAPTIGGPQ